MRWGELRRVLSRLSECGGEFEEPGLTVFFEIGYTWAEDYRILIRDEAIDEDNWGCLESRIGELGKRWRLVRRNEEIFLQVYTPIRSYQKHFHPSPLPGAINEDILKNGNNLLEMLDLGMLVLKKWDHFYLRRLSLV